MTTYFYTVMYNGILYRCSTTIRGVKKLSEWLTISKSRIRAGAVADGPMLTHEIIGLIRKQDEKK